MLVILSFQICSNDIDQLFCSFRSIRIGFVRRIDDVRTNMVFHDLGHQPVHCASDRGNELENVGAAGFSLQRALNRF